MPARVTAGQLKKAWADSLRDGLRDRGFRRMNPDLHRRPFEGGTDDLVLRLQAAGGGETRVEVLHLGVGVTIDAAEEQAAQLRGGSLNPNIHTKTDDLFALAAQSPNGHGPTREQLVVLDTDQLADATSRILSLVDEVAEPWLERHHDSTALLQELLADTASHHLERLETITLLALQLNDRAAARSLIDKHKEELERRGFDHPAFEKNRRWRSGVEDLLQP